ncbi:MAG: 50S ribosomal protein L25 [Phycisphaerae bacterium]
MEIPTLSVEPRKAAGSRATARLRRGGKLPAILYGHGREAATLSLDTHDVEQQLEHGMHIVNLNMDGTVQACQFKDVQYDYLGTNPIHVDLIRVDLSERITLNVSLEFRGTPEGVGEGGVFRHELTDIEIACVVSEIPDSIRVDISHLGLDQILYVKDIELPEGMTAVTDPEAVVGMVRLPIAAPETPVAEEGEAPIAEPEVISKGKAEEESGEEKS